MKFSKAYCTELNKNISPYEAREYYFDEGSEFYQKKLTFKCEDSICRADLVAVNIYNKIRAKKASHYRTRPKTDHLDECCFFAEDKEISGRAEDAKNSEKFKRLKFPSEFLLERPEIISDGKRVRVTEVTENSAKITRNTKPANNQTNKESTIKTSCLDHLVDCFLIGKQSDLKNNLLTINGKTKYFKNFFKKIEYFKDEEGLIYYGKIKELKPYGKNYSIGFKSWVDFEGKSRSISIYLEENLIKNYRKHKLLLEQLNEMANSGEEIMCFFVGAYPKIDEGVDFKPLKVEIRNLDHIALIYDNSSVASPSST